MENRQISPYANWDCKVTDKYSLLADAYYGKGGFENGDYLVPHIREAVDKYERRKFMNYYTNYVKTCIDSNVNPIFKQKPVREYTPNPIYDAFLKSVNTGGYDMNRFIRKTAIEAKLYGGVLAVIDNFAELAANQKEALDKRQFPYLYTVKPYQVKDWVVDRFGELIKVSYWLEYSELDEKGNKIKQRETWSWTATEWTCQNSHGETNGTNVIGIIPVIPLFGALKDDDMGESFFPQSEYYQIAKCNLAIYNACSELRERNRNQAFSILAFPIAEQDDYEDASRVLVGTNNVLLYRNGDNSAAKPSYVEPGTAPSDMLLAEIQYLIQEIYRMAERASVTGVQAYESGTAKAWDNNVGYQTAAEFANSIEEFERKIAAIFGRYIGTDLNFTVSYSKDYEPVDMKSTLDKITTALTYQLGGKFDVELCKSAARSIFHEADDSLLLEILQDIETNGISHREAQIDKQLANENAANKAANGA